MEVQSHSRSMFNFSTAQGWTDDDVEVLRKAIIQFGFGKWKTFQETGVLPGKNITQMNLQTQRMCLQQSLGGFMNLNIDINDIRRENQKIIDEYQSASTEGKKKFLKEKKIKIKNGLIINDGANPTSKSRQELIEKNRNQYALTEERKKEILEKGVDIFSVKSRKRELFIAFLQEYLAQRKEEDRKLLKKKKRELRLKLAQETKERAEKEQLQKEKTEPMEVEKENPEKMEEAIENPEKMQIEEEKAQTEEKIQTGPETKKEEKQQPLTNIEERIQKYLVAIDKKISGMSVKHLEREMAAQKRAIANIIKVIEEKQGYKEVRPEAMQQDA